MKIEASELEGAALDWAVLVVTGGDRGALERMLRMAAKMDRPAEVLGGYHPSTNWSQGGPLIERYHVTFLTIGKSDSLAAMVNRDGKSWPMRVGSSHLTAAMRSIVAFELGDTVDIPEEMLA